MSIRDSLGLQYMYAYYDILTLVVIKEVNVTEWLNR